MLRAVHRTEYIQGTANIHLAPLPQELFIAVRTATAGIADSDGVRVQTRDSRAQHRAGVGVSSAGARASVCLARPSCSVGFPQGFPFLRGCAEAGWGFPLWAGIGASILTGTKSHGQPVLHLLDVLQLPLHLAGSPRASSIIDTRGAGLAGGSKTAWWA